MPDDSLASTAVAVLAKPPEPGEVKTRLTDRLSASRAADLYQAFLADTATLVGDLALEETSPSRLFAHAGEADHPGFEPFRDAGFTFIDQGSGNLGDRLARVIDWSFDRGVEQLALLGSDSPTLRPRHLADGFERLEPNDVVLGPAFDGGYYLLQMAGPHTEIVRGIDWSTPRVMEQTLMRSREAGLETELIEFWYDVDDFADLDRLRYHLLGYLRDGDGDAAPATADALRRLQREEGVFEDSVERDKTTFIE